MDSSKLKARLAPFKMGIAEDLDAKYRKDTIAELLSPEQPFEGMKAYLMKAAGTALAGKFLKLKALVDCVDDQGAPIGIMLYGKYANNWEQPGGGAGGGDVDKAYVDAADTLIRTSINNKADKTDPRFTDARTPLPHTHDDRYYTENEVDNKLALKADTVHVHTPEQIQNLVEFIQDTVAQFVGGTNISATYNDADGTLVFTANVTAGGLDNEAVRDVVGAALIPLGLIDISINDALDTISFSTTATKNQTDAFLVSRANHTGTQDVSTITGLAQVAITGNYAHLTGLPTIPPAPDVTRAQVDALNAAQDTIIAGKASVNDPRFTDSRTPLPHTHTAANISDLTEAVQDIVGAFLGAANGAQVTYDDANNTLVVAFTGSVGGTYDPEAVRDTIGAALIPLGLITINANDAGDTITIGTTATANSSDAQLRDRSTHTGTQSVTTISDIAQVAKDNSYNSLFDKPTIPAAADVTKAYVDSANAAQNTTIGNKADKTDPRFTDARTPLPHTHPTADITGLAEVAKTNSYLSLTDRPAAGSSTGTQWAPALMRFRVALDATLSGTFPIGTVDFFGLSLKNGYALDESEFTYNLSTRTFQITDASLIATGVVAGDIVFGMVSKNVAATGTYVSKEYVDEQDGILRIAINGKVDSTDPRLSDARNPLAHTHLAAHITDFTEAVQDAVGAFLGAGAGTNVAYDDVNNTLVVSFTGTAGETYDPEKVRDTIGAALIPLGLITLSVNDAGDTITIGTSATQNQTDAYLLSRGNHTGTQAQSTVAGLELDLAARLPLAGNTDTTLMTGDIKFLGTKGLAWGTARLWTEYSAGNPRMLTANFQRISLNATQLVAVGVPGKAETYYGSETWSDRPIEHKHPVYGVPKATLAASRAATGSDDIYPTVAYAKDIFALKGETGNPGSTYDPTKDNQQDARITTLEQKATVTTYYVSPAGSDSNSGLSTNQAWATLAKVNAAAINPGDTVAFYGGAEFVGQLIPKPGAPGRAISYTSYGPGRAKIIGDAVDAVLVRESHNIFYQLDLIGRNSVELRDNGFYICPTVPISNILISNCSASGFGAQGGYAYPQNQYASYTGVVVNNCDFFDNKMNGVSFIGNYDVWPVYRNNTVYVHHCRFYRNTGSQLKTNGHTGSGFIMGSQINSLVEHCEAWDNGGFNGATAGGPMGIWMFDCLNCTIQYCEAARQKNGISGTSRVDGGGFDIDGGCEGCVIQYCYSHDNDGCGQAFLEYGSANQFKNNHIRFNVSINDARCSSHEVGAFEYWTAAANSTDCYCYNNLFYMDNASSITWARATIGSIISNGSKINNLNVFNNIFIVNGQGLDIYNSGVTDKYGTYFNNIYWGINGANLNFNTGGSVVDPQLWKVFQPAIHVGGSVHENLSSFLNAYQLKPNSPAVKTGVIPAGITMPDRDFFGVRFGISPGIGIGPHNLDATSVPNGISIISY
jgi:hypothetical protein